MRRFRFRPSASLWLSGFVLLATALCMGGVACDSPPTGPSGDLPPWLRPVAQSLGLTSAPAVAGEWAIDSERVPETPGDPKLTAPLGQIPNPFTQTDAHKAFELYRDARLPEARVAAERAWQSPTLSDGGERELFAFLLVQLRSSADDKAGALLAARTAATHPVLGPYALRYVASRADDQGLSNVVTTLAQGRIDPALRLLKARALRRSAKVPEAATELSALSPEKGSALWRRVQAERMRTAHARGQEAEAMTLARELMASKSNQAEEVVDLLLGTSDETWLERLKKRPEDAPAVLDALVYAAQRRRYARAIPGLEALANQEGVAIAVRCHARSWAAKALDRKGAFDKSLALYAILEKGCTDPTVHTLVVDEPALGPGDVAFRMGRAQLLLGNGSGAVLLKKALAQGLSRRDSEDARTLLQSLDKVPETLAVLKQRGVTVAQDYAERDLIDVAVWYVAMDRMIAGKWREALPLLDRLAEVRDSDLVAQAQSTLTSGVDRDVARYDDRDWARGRADYFAGRALDAMGKHGDAVARWQRVVRRHPLSYFATLALAQLKDGSDDRDVAAVEPELQPQTGEAAGPRVTADVLADPRVQRARLLGALGWAEDAGDELDAAGLGRDVAAEQRWAAGDPSGAWTRAALDAEAGRYIASHAVGRDLLRRFAMAYPNDANRDAWQLAYPRAFQSLIDAAAKEFGLHPSIVYAICRSESGFNPRVESHAAAIGLLQLILPTAQAMAKPLGLTADAQTLRQPAVNVRLGARYLKLLLDRFDREAQMAAGYNAGGGAVGRWRKQRGDWPLDLFVETIPFRETRDYAKRVLSAIAVYRNLYDGEPLHAFALAQKPMPVAEDAPTEPSSGTQNVAVVQKEKFVPAPQHHAVKEAKHHEKPEPVVVAKLDKPRHGHPAAAHAAKPAAEHKPARKHKKH